MRPKSRFLNLGAFVELANRDDIHAQGPSPLQDTALVLGLKKWFLAPIVIMVGAEKVL